MPRMFIRIEYDGRESEVRGATNRALDAGVLQDLMAELTDVTISDVSLLGSDLAEVALSMEHHDHPAVRSYGHMLRRRIENK